MSTWKYMLLAGAAAVLPLAAAAQEAPVAVVVAHDEAAPADAESEAALAGAKAKMQKEMDEAIALVEKIFDTSDLPPVEPARLALAQRTTAALIPDGSLEKMVDNLYGKMFRTILEETGGTSDMMLSIKTGVESDKIAALDAGSKKAVADLFDPYRKEREDQVMKVVRPLLSEALADLEPPMRAGLAKAYARRFSAGQLTELNGFFATPTGGLYAGEAMTLQADPEVMLAMIKAVPPLVNKFIDRAPKIAGDMKELPKEKALADLSDAELAKLAKLMKVDVQTLKDNRDMWSETATEAEAADTTASDDWSSTDATDTAVDAAADAAVAADAAAAAADAAVDDPAYDRNNWSEADRQRVEQLEAAANTASSAAFDAQDEAVANARKKIPSP